MPPPHSPGLREKASSLWNMLEVKPGNLGGTLQWAAGWIYSKRELPGSFELHTGNTVQSKGLGRHSRMWHCHTGRSTCILGRLLSVQQTGQALNKLNLSKAGKHPENSWPRPAPSSYSSLQLGRCHFFCSNTKHCLDQR